MSVIAAIEKGDAEALEAALAADATACDERSGTGVPAYLYALYYGRREFSQRILEAGARLDFYGSCALGLTAEVERLLDANPSLVVAYSGDGWTGLHLAAFFGSAEMVSVLLARGADPLARSKNGMANLALHAAAAGRHAKAAKLLLVAGSPVNEPQKGGFTPLHSACQNNDQEMIAMLLRNGADPHQPNDEAKTPYDLLPKS